MIKKTYRTFSLKSYEFEVKDQNGKEFKVAFRGGIYEDSTARFSTAREDIQKAVEGRRAFGETYYLESTQIIEDKTEAPAPAKPEPAKAPEKEIIGDMKDSRRFRNLVEMKNAMRELGIPLDDDANYVKAKAEAAKAGYDFQIKK